MKYVRVYESDCYPEEYITTYKNHCEHVCHLQDAGFDFEGCIIKQADTIEELCDEFILVHTEDDESSKDIFVNENGWFSHRGDHYYDFSLELVKKGKREIFGTFYGAIWTDKGLIYVAKMNKEGKLELL